MKKLSKNIPTTDNQVSKMKPTEIECINKICKYLDTVDLSELGKVKLTESIMEQFGIMSVNVASKELETSRTTVIKECNRYDIRGVSIVVVNN